MNLRELRDRFERFWFAPEAQVNLTAARVILAASALWVVLSRRDLPSVLQLPDAIWQTVSLQTRLRFLIALPVQAERGLWLALHAFLFAALFGLWRRWSCLRRSSMHS